MAVLVVEMLMPKFGWEMTEGTVQSWLKKEGDRVRKDEPICVIETEKVTVELPSPATGILSRIVAPEGSTVPAQGLMAVIAESGEATEALHRIEPAPAESVAAAEAEAKPARGPRPTVEERVKASPLARKLAEEHGIDLAKVHGSGPGGRIVREDVLRAVEQARAGQAPEASAGFDLVPMSSMRRTIAQRLTMVHQTTVPVSLTVEVDASNVSELRRQLAPEVEKKANVKLSFTALAVKAVAIALREHPLMNSTLEGDSIKVFREVNVGVAVAVEDGLVVPVIRHADEASLVDVAVKLNALVEKARLGRLTLEDVSGGTFTVTNLGMFEVDAFTPMLNPPETGILALGRIAERPVAVQNTVTAKPTMYMTLTFDHRVLDGAAAAKFLKRVKEILENPYVMLIPSGERRSP
ncbi:MAG: dihydrolipoamide acetyltransferase family protein [Candidatus Bathyarchaeia archaeon]